MATRTASRRFAAMTAAGALVALSLTVSSPALALDSAASSARSLTSPVLMAEGEPMNYAVNLNAGTASASFEKAVALAGNLGVVLSKYPNFSSFFVQSVDPQFASKLGQALTDAGIGFDSIGPTRTASVTGAEVVVPLENPATVAAANTRSATGLADGSQLEEFTPDPDSEKAWGLAAIGATEAAKVDVKLAPVVVGILDTGIVPDHPDLKDQINTELSVACHVNGIPRQGAENWADDHYHGTHVAGTVAAAHNGAGIDGVAPSATLAAVKVSNVDGFFYPEYVACGFSWAADHHFGVTNNSYYVDPWAYWLPNEPTQAAGLEVVKRAVQYANDQGVVNVVAAGNSAHDLDHPTTDDESPNDNGEDHIIKGRDVANGFDIPAMLDSVVTVSSVMLPANTDPATGILKRSGFSNYGVKNVEVAAPGSRIYSTFPASKNYYGAISGTSMASPHVAGVVALLRAVDPTRSVAETKEVLYRQAKGLYSRLAEPTDGREYRGHGLANALGAVLEDQPAPVVALSYSTDAGATWNEFAADTQIRDPFVVRAHVTGPATSIRLNLSSENAAVDALLPKLAQEADGAFDGDITLSTEVIDPTALRAAAAAAAKELGGALSAVEDDSPLALAVNASANGRNNDERAKDDAAVEAGVQLLPAPASVVPTSSQKPAAQDDQKAKEPTFKPAAARAAKGLAATGVDTAGLFTLVMLSAVAGCGGVAMARRRS